MEGEAEQVLPFFFLRDSSEGRGAGSRWPDRFGAHPTFLSVQAWFELMG